MHRRRTLSTSFVVIFAVACDKPSTSTTASKDRPTSSATASGMSARARKVGTPRATKTVSDMDVPKEDGATVLNPKTPAGEKIFADGARCYTQGYPTAPTVDCPPAMDDPAWDSCAGGTITRSAKGDRCVCTTTHSNPPPPPIELACPR